MTRAYLNGSRVQSLGAQRGLILPQSVRYVRKRATSPQTATLECSGGAHRCYPRTFTQLFTAVHRFDTGRVTTKLVSTSWMWHFQIFCACTHSTRNRELMPRCRCTCTRRMISCAQHTRLSPIRFRGTKTNGGITTCTPPASCRACIYRSGQPQSQLSAMRVIIIQHDNSFARGTEYHAMR